MPIIRAVERLFPDSASCWTLCEICDRLRQLDESMNYDRVYRAFRSYDTDDGARSLVAPIGKHRPLRFNTTGARLIARHAMTRSFKSLLRAAELANADVVEKSRANANSAQSQAQQNAELAAAPD